MASVFIRQEISQELCERYAGFASHMVRWQFKIIYWTLFISNLFVLFLASWTYTRGQESLERYAHNSKKRTKRLRQSIFLCLGCVAVSTAIVIMEAYAIMALQFCDGEDLISLYWSTWTMVQVGSLIAMVGIILAMAHSLSDRRHPPWALALGTPVLVIAGFLHLFHDCTRQRIKKQMQKKIDQEEAFGGPPMSQANTIQVNPDDEPDDEYRGEVVGFSISGGPIIRFTDSMPDPLPNHTRLLGYCEDSRPIVICDRDSIRMMTESPRPIIRTPIPAKKEKEEETS
ncbi:hypothetical protein BGZ61DRAFT_474675 [Ilyonectria robusta]|uniref:uncharacterized protein n=1 Tax=Ilyonectria robusta TaxID=1079257 RepID=UPI001E8E2771|nr:uncharacterized protein BGZ61DRAFT_474675 [Ilyonectria robusta]KAH6988097.1 hypothetical protein BKA56DRAFT_630050 [Ilyonectria sp. MPI-CAGE-AT-0026]KAH8734061.1 hypothetical protein BGZ61DRAFT_474675 [Ilyonectria robusta]